MEKYTSRMKTLHSQTRKEEKQRKEIIENNKKRTTNYRIQGRAMEWRLREGDGKEEEEEEEEEGEFSAVSSSRPGFLETEV